MQTLTNIACIGRYQLIDALSDLYGAEAEDFTGMDKQRIWGTLRREQRNEVLEYLYL